MLWLYIILAIAALILLLLLVPVCVYIDYNETLTVRFRFLLFTINLYPRKERKPKKEKKKQSKAKKPEQEKKQSSNKKWVKNRPIVDIVNDIHQTVVNLVKTFKFTVKHIIISRCDVKIIVSSDDAASTAINYGRVSAVVNGLVAFVANFAKLKRANLDIAPNFLAGESSAVVGITLRFRMFFGIAAFLKLLTKSCRNVFNLLKSFDRVNSDEGSSNEDMPNDGTVKAS